jgi:hypothetical protein
MRPAVIIGAGVLGAVALPAIAVAPPSPTGTASSPTYVQGQTPPGIQGVYSGPPPGSPVVCHAYAGPGATGPFDPSPTTLPGTYVTACDANGVPTNPGTMTVLPSLRVARIASVVVGGGQLPLGITLLSSGDISINATRGAVQARTTAHISGAGRSLVSLPLVDTHGHRLAAGRYSVTVTDTAGAVSSSVRFPVAVGAGGSAPRIALALPGGRIGPTRPLHFTFSAPVAAIRAFRPTISPAVRGRWITPTPYEAVFTPAGLGFSPGAVVSFSDRNAVWISTGTHTLTASVRSLSAVRAVQILAQLGYLPLNFTATSRVPRTAAGQAQAAAAPPSGHFSWRYRHIPAPLARLWTANRSLMVRGALMAFDVDHHLTMDGSLGAQTWRALQAAAISGRGNHFGYSFVHVYRSLPQHVVVWHNGRNVFSTLANTGIAGRQTNYGIFPIYLRQTVGSMSGTNPDGSHYNDGGIRWISYFSGGDALHQFSRPGYGYPQSLGCVEMTDAGAHRVFELTEYGTLVDTLS